MTGNRIPEGSGTGLSPTPVCAVGARRGIAGTVGMAVFSAAPAAIMILFTEG